MEPTSGPINASYPYPAAASAFAFGPFHLQLPERSLKRHGIPVALGSRAFDILACLVQHAGQVVRHDDLVAHVWADVKVSPGTPRVHLTALRKVLGCRSDSTRYIANIPGRGYSFVAPGVTPVVLEQDASERAYLNRRSVEHLQQLAGLPLAEHPQRKSEVRMFGTKRRLHINNISPEEAKQILAKLNALNALVCGSLKSIRGVDPAFGENDERDSPTSDISRVEADLRSVLEGGDSEMTRKRRAVAAAIALLTCVADVEFPTARAQTLLQTAEHVTHYRTAMIGGVSLFYREAGSPSGPVVVLLHGFPTSSHMFRNLIPALADRYHVIAPDYPGFGQSGAPDHTQFAYTFAHYATLLDTLLQHLGVARYAMYVMDYGAPVGYRLALLHPERVTALVVQNGNAYVEGLGTFWDPIKAYWADGSEARRRALNFLVLPETTKFQYTDGVSDVSRVDPDNWVHDQALLDRPGNRDIQLDLFHDYGANVPLYPEFQAFFRKYQPPTLIVWGKNDKIFPAAGAGPYLRDLPKAELHLLDTGHFALEDKLDVMAPMIHDFLDRSLASK